MAKPGFKQTEIGEIPEEWELKFIHEFAQTKSGGTPQTKVKEYWENGSIPWINSGELKDAPVLNPTTHITTEASENSAAKIFPKESVLIALTGATTGKVGLLTFDSAVNQSVTAIFPSERHIPKYLFYYLIESRQSVLSHNIGAAQPHINKKIVDGLLIALPPLPEQKKIASVLSTVDAAIEKTSEIIEQAKQLKKGLMQELLTRGIGHKKFKQTEIGEIPEEWEVSKLGDLCNIQVGKTPSRKIKEYWDKKKTTRNKWASIADMLGNKIIKDTNEYITDKAIADTRIKRVSAGTLLMSFKLTVGRMAFAGVDLFTNEAIAALAPRDSNSISTDYLYYAIEQARPESYCDPAVKGKTLNQPKIKSILLPLPPLPEQKKIAEILGVADAKIEAEVQKREQLQTLKKGLMQDLLTGRVRFPEFVKGVNS